MSFQEIMYKGFLGYYLGETGTESGILFFALSVMGFLIITILPYMLGSLNFAIIISKMFYHEDIRAYGSGNAGMTNMLRTYGKLPAVSTFVCDALKAVVSVLIGRLVWGAVGAYVAGFACVMGHVFPVFYRFKGGKGVVASVVVVFMTNWKVGIVLVLIFLGLVASTKFVSLGSVMAALLYPLILSRMNKTDPQIVMVFAFAITVLVVVKHRSNIKRLIEGTESKISFSSKKESTDKNEKKKGREK